MIRLTDSNQEILDLKLYIGQKYPSFFESDRKIRSWNFSGLFFGMFWLTYRKRYLIVSFFILIDIMVSLLFQDHLFYWLAFALLMHLYIGRSGNLLYLAGTKKQIKQIRAKNKLCNESEIKRLLMQKGRTSRKFILPLLIYFVLFHSLIFGDELGRLIEILFIQK